MSGLHLLSVHPSRPLRDDEDGRGDKEPVPPPSCLPFVALSPSPLVTRDYALSTGDQVLLFACNSTAISVNLCLAANVHTMCPLTVLHIMDGFPSSPLTRDSVYTSSQHMTRQPCFLRITFPHNLTCYWRRN